MLDGAGFLHQQYSDHLIDQRVFMYNKNHSSPLNYSDELT